MAWCGAPHPERPEITCEREEYESHAEHVHIGATLTMWPNLAYRGVVPKPGRPDEEAGIPSREERNQIWRNAVKNNRTPRETSLQAAATALPSSGSRRRQVYDWLLDHPSTDDEVSEALHLIANTVRPRRGELVESGLVVDSGQRRPSASGNEAIVWRAVPLA